MRASLGGQGDGAGIHGGRRRKGAAPASSRARCCAQKEGKTGWGYWSPFKGEAGELEGEKDATTVEPSNGGGSGGAPV
jgi:hypothetical protein